MVSRSGEYTWSIFDFDSNAKKKIKTNILFAFSGPWPLSSEKKTVAITTTLHSNWSLHCFSANLSNLAWLAPKQCFGQYGVNVIVNAIALFFLDKCQRAKKLQKEIVFSLFGYFPMEDSSESFERKTFVYNLILIVSTFLIGWKIDVNSVTRTFLWGHAHLLPELLWASNQYGGYRQRYICK